MSKKTFGLVALLGIVALSALLVNCGSSSSRPSGLLYVVSQAQSQVSSYAINLESGALGLINTNAPVCASGTTNCTLPVSMFLDPTSKVAFLLNQGNSSTQPTITSYSIGSEGNLGTPSTAATLPLATGATSIAMTRDAAGAFIFAINGSPTPNPTDCLTNGNNSTDCPSITVYTTTPGSATVTQASTYNLSRVPTAVSAITYTPQGASSAQTVLVMTSNFDLTPTHNDNEISVFLVNSSGVLSEQPGSPYTAQANPGSVFTVNTNPPQQNTGGIFVYVGSQPPTGGGALNGYLMCSAVGKGIGAGCSQQQVDNTTLQSVGTPSNIGQNPVAMLTDPTNSFLYIACNLSSQVYGFKMNIGNGSLSALTPASVPTGAQPVALAIHNNFNGSGLFIYTSNNTGQSVTGIPIVATTGAMGPGQTTQFLPGQPGAMAAK